MKEVPDIVKQLREAERLGMLQSNIQISCEESEIQENKPTEENTDKTISLIQDDTWIDNKLRNIRDLYKTVFENSAVAITVTDKNEKIIIWNNYAENLLGMNKEELYMKPVKTFYPPEEWKKIRRQNIRQKGMQHHLETKILRKNNEPLDVDISLSVLKDDDENITGSIGIIKDISERKQAEGELKKAHDLLNTINKDLERKIKKRTAEVERLLRQKDEFISQLGHDLKTPLAPLINLLPIVLEKEKNPKSKERLKVSIQCISYIRDLVIKNLDLAKLNSLDTNFNFEEITLSSEVKHIVESNQLLFQESNINVENKIDENIIVNVDKLRFMELLNNLLTNAIKYTPDGGTVSIDAENEKDTIKVSIRDSGIGLTKEQIEHIFDEFYKVDKARHDLDSSGLGLAICKRIVEKHGGRMWVESPGKGKGSTFYFTLKITGGKKQNCIKNRKDN
jgi:PAS domain S-box-containing protein